MAGKIIVCTWARNAEKTLPRAVESIFSQTYQDWIYYLIDNASSDDTPKLMREYAKRDGRVTALYKEENNMQVFLEIAPAILEKYDDDDYFIQLDADDVYKPDCFMKLIDFAGENRLDAAICGSDILSEEDGSLIERRSMEQDTLLENGGFCLRFPEYYNFLRTFWGKLCKMSLLRRCEFRFPPALVYGVDTFFALEIFRQSDRIGIFSETLHEYYVSRQSVSYRFDPTRAMSDRLLYECGRAFLLSKDGEVSDENESFLREVYFQATRATLKLIAGTDIGAAAKLRAFCEIFGHSNMRRIFMSKFFSKITEKLGIH